METRVQKGLGEAGVGEEKDEKRRRGETRLFKVPGGRVETQGRCGGCCPGKGRSDL